MVRKTSYLAVQGAKGFALGGIVVVAAVMLYLLYGEKMMIGGVILNGVIAGAYLGRAHSAVGFAFGFLVAALWLRFGVEGMAVTDPQSWRLAFIIVGIIGSGFLGLDVCSGSRITWLKVVLAGSFAFAAGVAVVDLLNGFLLRQWDPFAVLLIAYLGPQIVGGAILGAAVQRLTEEPEEL